MGYLRIILSLDSVCVCVQASDMLAIYVRNRNLRWVNTAANAFPLTSNLNGPPWCSALYRLSARTPNCEKQSGLKVHMSTAVGNMLQTSAIRHSPSACCNCIWKRTHRRTENLGRSWGTLKEISGALSRSGYHNRFWVSSYTLHIYAFHVMSCISQSQFFSSAGRGKSWAAVEDRRLEEPRTATSAAHSLIFPAAIGVVQHCRSRSRSLFLGLRCCCWKTGQKKRKEDLANGRTGELANERRSDHGPWAMGHDHVADDSHSCIASGPQPQLLASPEIWICLHLRT